MIRSSFALTPSLQFFSQILRAAPVLYFKKGHKMERVRKIKKGDPTFCISPLLRGRIKRSLHLLSALLARSFFERKLYGATGKKQKHTDHFWFTHHQIFC